MANKKISELTGLTTPEAGDLFPVTDISDTITSGSPSGTTKRVTLTNLMAQAPVQSVAGKSGVVTLANADVSGSASSVSLATDKSALQALINLRATQVSLATDKASLTGLINARATGAQGTLADSATQPGDNISTLTNNSNFITSAGSPVQSVASKTGAVTLVNADVSGSASSVSLATDKASLTSLINLRALTSSLGTASTKDVGPNADNVVQLNASAQLPAVDGSLLTGISSALSREVITRTASFTLSDSDSGKVINCDLGSRIDVTIPAGLLGGFNCKVVQKGVGRVRFLTDGTTSLNSYHATGSEPNAVIGRYGVVDLVNTTTNAYHLDGNYEYLFVYTNNWSNAFDGGGSQEFRTTALSRPSGTWSENIPYTLSAWVKPNATGGDGGVIGLLPITSSSTGSNSSYVGSFYHTSGTKYAWYQGNENQGGGAFSVGSWNHLVQIWDGSYFKAYIDGVLVVSVLKTNNGLGTGGTIAIHGSSRARWNDRAPIGIDEISMWDTALTDGGVSVGTPATGQIATLYNSGTPSDLTSLSPIGWWLMGDSQTGQTNGGATPTTITDVGIGAHSKADGTLYGSATYSNQTP